MKDAPPLHIKDTEHMKDTLTENVSWNRKQKSDPLLPAYLEIILLS